MSSVKHLTANDKLSMDSENYIYLLLAAVVGAFLLKLYYFNIIQKKRYKMFFRSFSKWYRLTSLIVDLDESVETFMRISNYCNLVIWMGGGLLIWLSLLKLIFPDN